MYPQKQKIYIKLHPFFLRDPAKIASLDNYSLFLFSQKIDTKTALPQFPNILHPGMQVSGKINSLIRPSFNHAVCGGGERVFLPCR